MSMKSGSTPNSKQEIIGLEDGEDEFLGEVDNGDLWTSEDYAVIEPSDFKEAFLAIGFGCKGAGAFECEVNGFNLWDGADYEKQTLSWNTEESKLPKEWYFSPNKA